MYARISLILILVLALSPPAIAQPLKCVPGVGSVYVKNLQQGEKDLLQLANTSDREDLWLYCNGRWYDIGEEINKMRMHPSFTEIYRLLKAGAFPPKAKVFMYHIHPVKNTPNPLDSMLVSGPDFDAACWYSNIFNKLKRKIHSRMVNIFGVFEYKLSDEIIAQYGYQTGLPESIKSSIVLLQSEAMDMSLLNVSLPTYIELKEYDEIPGCIERYCARLEEYFLYVKFREIQKK